MNSVWPDSKKCAVCFTFDLDAEYVYMGTNPDVNMSRVLTQGDYVWRSGIIPRLFDLFDKNHIKSTWYVVAMNAVNHPEEVAEVVERGHQIATHGWIHENINNLSREDEQKRRVACVEALKKATGYRPIGNRVAGGEPSPHTFDLLKELDLLYDNRLRGGDMPYRLENGLIEIPSYYEMDDFHLFADYPFGN